VPVPLEPEEPLVPPGAGGVLGVVVPPWEPDEPLLVPVPGELGELGLLVAAPVLLPGAPTLLLLEFVSRLVLPLEYVDERLESEPVVALLSVSAPPLFWSQPTNANAEQRTNNVYFISIPVCFLTGATVILGSCHAPRTIAGLVPLALLSVSLLH
jgi:hypothetical protein